MAMSRSFSPILLLLVLLLFFGLLGGVLVGAAKVLLLVLFALFVLGAMGTLSWRPTPPP
jgi:hypothetical protein